VDSLEEARLSELRIKGFDAIRQRMGELQAKLDSAFPSSKPAGFDGTLAGLIGQEGFAPAIPSEVGNINARAKMPGLDMAIRQAAERAGIDPALFDALVASESGYDPKARSRVGALGLTQLMPATAKEMGVTNPLDPIENLRGGAAFFAKMLDRFGGDPRLALAAYNAGPGAVEKHSGIPPFPETQSYVNRVMSLYEARRPR
jgi:soluble lytic murein transglycosylase-like protein